MNTHCYESTLAKIKREASYAKFRLQLFKRLVPFKIDSLNSQHRLSNYITDAWQDHLETLLESVEFNKQLLKIEIENETAKDLELLRQFIHYPSIKTTIEDSGWKVDVNFGDSLRSNVVNIEDYFKKLESRLYNNCLSVQVSDFREYINRKLIEEMSKLPRMTEDQIQKMRDEFTEIGERVFNKVFEERNNTLLSKLSIYGRYERTVEDVLVELKARCQKLHARTPKSKLSDKLISLGVEYRNRLSKLDGMSPDAIRAIEKRISEITASIYKLKK